jgi:hypothetical protein
MKTYKLSIDDDALQDIQNATDWYNEQLYGLGKRFQKQATSQISGLKSSASLYAIRYADVRCMRLKTFPFMVHYTLNLDTLLVEVFALIHTSRNPEIWKQRNL